jgi:nickel transport protein
LALCLASWSTPVLAHDLWLERTSQGYTLYSGHKHSAHEGRDVMEYDPGIVKLVACFDANGKGVPADVLDEYPVRISCSGAAVFVLTSTGCWTKTPYGTNNSPKGDTQMVVRSWLSYESIKRIDRWSDAFKSSLVDELELVPLVDALSLDAGDKLRLLVTRGGKPVKGVIVAYDDKPRGETGDDGRINLKIRHRGVQLIEASLTEPLGSPDADEVVTTTTLCFELPEEEG